MTRSPPKFMCVVPPKALVFDPTTGEMHRDDGHEQIHNNLKASQVNTAGVHLLQGGGIGVSSVPSSNSWMGRLNETYTFADATVCVAFMGELTNMKYLMLKSGMLDEQSWQSSNTPLANPAEVIMRLYSTLGHTNTVAKLRGVFSFVLYDSESARVFAARDPTGRLPLFQGTLEDKSMFVSNFEPEATYQHATVPAGHFVAGGRRSCVPERFLPEQSELNTQKQTAASAAKNALNGINGIRPRSSYIRRFYNDPSEIKQHVEPTPAVEQVARPTTPAVGEAEKPHKAKTKRGVRGGAGRRRRTSQRMERMSEVSNEGAESAEEAERAFEAPEAKVEIVIDVAKAEETIAALVRKFSNGNLQAMEGGMKRVGSCSSLVADEEETLGMTRVNSRSNLSLVS